MAQKLDKVLLDFKCAPQLIQPALLVIKENQGNWEKMKARLVERAKESGYQASEDNIVSAYVTPTLRKLRLITGLKDKLTLTSDGETLLSAAKVGEPEFRAKLASLLLLIDSEEQKLVELLIENHGSRAEAVRLEDLCRELLKVGFSNVSPSGTRLNGWVSMLKFVGVLVDVGERFYVDKNQVDVVRQGEVIPSDKEFRKVLLECYETARSKTEGSPYVPITDLRDCVSTKLNRMWRVRFDSLLEKEIREDESLNFVPATYAERKEGGMWIADKYYFFLAIFKN